MRLRGKDVLSLARRPDLSSYWIAREPAPPATETMKQPVLNRTTQSMTMSILAELWAFLRVRKKYWLAPIVLVLLVFGGLIILVQGSAVAPFIYTLF